MEAPVTTLPASSRTSSGTSTSSAAAILPVLVTD